MKQKAISKLEQKIMNIVWELNKCTVKDVYIELTKEKDIAYTTTATILIRLHKKGLVKRKMHGVFYYYYPKLSKESYSNNIISSFFKNSVESFGDNAIISFAESIEKLPAKKKDYLLMLLKDHDADK